VVTTAEVLEDNEAEVGYKDGDDGGVHSGSQGAWWQELFASPKKKRSAEKDSFEHFSPAPLEAHLEADVRGADKHERECACLLVDGARLEAMDTVRDEEGCDGYER
jgi:hypothetical protein